MTKTDITRLTGRRDGIVGIVPEKEWERELLHELDVMLMEAGLVEGSHWPDMKHAVRKLIEERRR